MVVGIVVGLLNIGSTHADPKPSWVVLKISRVEVKPTKVDGSTWDPPKDRNAAGCGLVAMVGKTMGPVGAVATLLCAHPDPSQQQRNPSAPDLFVQLVAGDARYRTPVVMDTFAQAFDFPIIVPLEGIPAVGLEVQVLDQDTDVGSGELIGMVRVTKKQIHDALASDAPLLTMSDSQVSKIEIEVAAYSPPPAIKPLTFEVNKNPVDASIRARAGELVTASAKGAYSVTDKRDPIDERGYTDHSKQGYNRPDFKGQNHGAAIAYVGSPTESRTAFVVGSCAAAVTTVSGPVFVGVNDGSVGNNLGSISFTVGVGLPTVEQWRVGGKYECLTPPAH